MVDRISLSSTASQGESETFFTYNKERKEISDHLSTESGKCIEEVRSLMNRIVASPLVKYEISNVSSESGDRCIEVMCMDTNFSNDPLL